MVLAAGDGRLDVVKRLAPGCRDVNDNHSVRACRTLGAPSPCIALAFTPHQRLGYGPVHACVDRNRMEVLRWLLGNGGRVNEPLPVRRATTSAFPMAHSRRALAEQRTGETPLHWAAAAGRVACIRALLAAGANKYQEDAVRACFRPSAVADACAHPRSSDARRSRGR